MFHVGALCKIKIRIYVWPIIDEFHGAFWIYEESLVSIVAIELGYFDIHTQYGVFKTKSFSSFYEPEEHFEILA